ncbi:TlpA family protein disulfide reductase [Zafaria sp. J156]|uniref:TlpA family protein disulfide reductase n=1 Tax=Zafaria sp. J156 TaxID=3116490 RepID=UPI002E7612C8|nr:TlpA disulfide reductase family protein [Zafaria sp. J156]MEE1622634.1 TlpA disulfide reductase family protein [Zafaria sp. J156]
MKKYRRYILSALQHPREPDRRVPGLLRRTGRRQVLAGLAGLAALPLLAACSSDDPLAAQAGNADGKNYIAGDGSVLEIAEEDRGEPVQFSSALFSGEPISANDLTGDPAVLNFWYAACAPCRVEAPDLQALHEQFEPEGVRFLGINVRDTVATAQAFERNFGITYPSVEDLNGQVLLAMTDYVPPQAVPTTIVLDRQGRVSARILGIAERSTLRTLITTVLDEQA